jgi:hypothetical protein
MLAIAFVRVIIFIPIFAIALWLRLGPWAFFTATFMLGVTGGCAAMQHDVLCMCFALGCTPKHVCLLAACTVVERKRCQALWHCNVPLSECHTVSSTVLTTSNSCCPPFAVPIGMRQQCLPWHAKTTTLRTHTRLSRCWRCQSTLDLHLAVLSVLLGRLDRGRLPGACDSSVS